MSHVKTNFWIFIYKITEKQISEFVKKYTVDLDLHYIKPIALKFKINPLIPILNVVNTILTNFQSLGVMVAMWSSGEQL